MTYRIEYLPGLILLGAVLLVLLVPPIAVIVVIVLASAALAAVAALAGAVLAMPYLLVRLVHRRLADRRHSVAGAGAIAAGIDPARRATRQSVVTS